jgi:hypothetical protein
VFFSADFVDNYRKEEVGQYKSQNLIFWLKFAFFFFFLALFVSEKLLKNYEMYLTNTQESVKNFHNFIYKLEVAISRLRVTQTCFQMTIL